MNRDEARVVALYADLVTSYLDLAASFAVATEESAAEFAPEMERAELMLRERTLIMGLVVKEAAA